MRRLLTILLSLIMIISMTACSNTSTEQPVAKPNEETKNPEANNSVADNYPNGSINVIVPFAAGGGQHVLATAVSSVVDTTMVITNVTGGGGATGTMETLHSKNDGYTVLCSTLNNIAAGSFNNTYAEPDAWERLVPVATVAGDRMMLIASKKSGYTSLEQIIEYSKANPGKVTITGATANSYTQKVIEKVMRDLDVEWKFIPFDGENACRNACMGGQIDLCLFGVGACSTAIDSGDCVGICSLTEKRVSFYPDYPTIGEVLGGEFNNYDFTVYRCFMLPPDTDTAIADKLAEILKNASENEDFQKTCKSLFLEVSYMDREQTADKLLKIYNQTKEMYAN